MATPLPQNPERTPLSSSAAQPSKRPRRRWWLLPVVALLLVLALGAAWVWLTPKASDNPVTATVPVTRGRIVKTVAATGKVEANFEVAIKAKASGRIIRLPYDVSDVVPKGALLVELDPIDESRNVSQATASLAGLESRTLQSRVNLDVAERTLETDIARAKADLRAAKAKDADARAKAKRLDALADQRYISQEEAETGRTTAAQAATDLQDAETRLRELETQRLALQSQTADLRYAQAQARAQHVAVEQAAQRLSETKIYAPIAGVVTTRPEQIGNIVASGVSNVGGGTAIMTLADLSHIYVLASVDESDIGQVRLDQPVEITADSFPGRKFQGRVVRIAPQGTEEANVVTFEVKIEVNSPDSALLKPAMTTNVEIVVADKPDVLKVSADAVQTDTQGREYVLVPAPEKNGGVRRQPVKTGVNNGSDVEILRGLFAGDSVVSGDGQARSRWRKDQPSSQQGAAGSNRRGQQMMMRSLGGGR